MSRIILTVICLLLFGACAPKRHAKVEPVVSYLDHRVSFQGETLGAISNWYTGSSANWEAIADANPGLQVRNIKVGQTIQIPDTLLRRRDPLTAEFLRKSSPELNRPNNDTQLALQKSPPAQEEQSEVKEVDSLPSQEAKGGGSVDDLFAAVSFGDVQKLNSLLSSGADPSSKYNGRPMLSWAAQNSVLEIVQALINAKADLNARDGVGHTPLMRAVETGQTSIAQALIDAGADLNLKTNEGKTAVHLAVDNNYGEILRALIKGKADLNATTEEGYSPALVAAQNSNLEMIALLAEGKASFDISNIIYTPLSYAVDQGNKELAAAIIKAGADPNAKTKQGSAPLHQALNDLELFNLLLSAKADPNVTNSRGETALMLAIQNNASDKVEALLKAGANPNLKSESGYTALSLAQNSMLEDVVQLLKSHGATE